MKGPQIAWVKVDGKPVKMQEDKLDGVAQKYGHLQNILGNCKNPT